MDYGNPHEMTLMADSNEYVDLILMNRLLLPQSEHLSRHYD